MIAHANTSGMMAAIINRNMATMLQLQSYYGMEDAMNLYEIIIVDNYNQHVLNED